jgi:hypothetical protein
MISTTSEFAWWVPVAGYKWDTDSQSFGFATVERILPPPKPGAQTGAAGGTPADGGQVGSPARADGEARLHLLHRRLGSVIEAGERKLLVVPIKWYYPLREYTGLFRTFSEVRPSIGGVLAFVNQYGPLRGNDGGWRFDWWMKHMLALRRARHIWDLWRAKEFKELGLHFRWQTVPGKAPVLIYESHPRERPEYPGETRTEVLAAEDRLVGSWRSMRGKEAFLAAPIYLSRLLTDRMRKSVTTRYDWDPNEGRLLRRDIPVSLLGAIWLQFQQSIAGDKDYRACPRCGAWFEVSRLAARSDKEYCSTACRSKAYRERKKEAQQMRARGLSIKEIAAELGSTQETVKEWLSHERTKGGDSHGKKTKGKG